MADKELYIGGVSLDTNELNAVIHYGVKGMKWGIRRFQNDDGTFTKDGKERYKIDENGKMSEEGKKLYNQDRKESVSDAKEYAKKLAEDNPKAYKISRAKEFIPIYGPGVTMLNNEKRKALAYEVYKEYGATTTRDFIKQDKVKRMITNGAILATTAAASVGISLAIGAPFLFLAWSDQSQDYLEHYGVKGMKWGIRRWQNEDGSLTEEGKKRYGVNSLDGELSEATYTKYLTDYTNSINQVQTNIATASSGVGKISEASNKLASLPYKKGHTKFGRYPKLSDEDLNRNIKRMKLEQEYSNLVGDTVYVKTGSEKRHELLQNTGIILSSVAALGSAIGMFYGAMSKRK